jgi:hypothetical protein
MEIFKTFKVFAKKKSEMPLKRLRCNNGHNYSLNTFKNNSTSEGIKVEYVLYSP